MNRRFDFRVWDLEAKEMFYFPITAINRYHANRCYNGAETHILMQGLGVADKNTVFIYEGDIVIAEPLNPSYQGIVAWCVSAAAFGIKSCVISGYLGLHSDWGYYTIIGNIYEHPHLLENKENG